MRRRPLHSARRGEEGIIISLVAIFMLFVVGAMAALAIDVVTLYTARSEAQLAADGAALAGARVLANSGMTSDANAATDNLQSNAVSLATTIALQVAASNSVGGTQLNAGASNCAAEICVSINTALANFLSNPQVQVTVQRTTLPTFFARIWGTTTVAVKATATAEAYNPSLLAGVGASEPPVAPVCVKPWLLPNISPNNPALQIFNTTTGAIGDTGLLGWETVSQTSGTNPAANTYLWNACTGTGACTSIPAPSPWYYLPGDPSSFATPPAASVSCSPTAFFYSGTPYQLSVAGCVQTPIACNQTVNIDVTDDITNQDTAAAVNCLTHATGNHADSVDETTYAGPPNYAPFEFEAGGDDPLVTAGTISVGTDMPVSDSLVTVPVFNSTGTITSPATVIGFVQLFLNPEGHDVHMGGMQAYKVHTMVTNLIGCGTGATGTPAVNGNGSSAVAVRLITP